MITITANSAHANLVSINEIGVLLMGPSKSGKSNLSYQLINLDPKNNKLVADDLVLLSFREHQLWGTCPVSGYGKLALRDELNHSTMMSLQENLLIHEHPVHLLAHFGPPPKLPELMIQANLNFYSLENIGHPDLIKNLLNTIKLNFPPILISSFGFKFQNNSENLNTIFDLIFDLRDLPNPYWHEDLRPYSGIDPPVENFFSNSSEMQKRIDQIINQISGAIDSYIKNQKIKNIRIGVGCTGGKHRSVFAVHTLAKRLLPKYPSLRFEHRDQDQW